MVKEKFYTATNEDVFYYCIGKDLRKAKIFIEQVIKRPIYKIEIKNVKLLKDYMYTKEKTLDYLVLTDIGYINIEINNYNKEIVHNGNNFTEDNYLLCAIDLEPDDIDKISEGNEELTEFKEMLEEINDREDFVKWISAEEAQIIQNAIINEAKEEVLRQEIE